MRSTSLPLNYIKRRLVTHVIPACFLAFMLCSTIIYLNFDHIIDFFGLRSYSSPFQSNSRKRGLSIYDRRIVYRDFNYLNTSTLTYTNKLYSKDSPILYRLPSKTPPTALLLIFHGCGRSPQEWFHTIERQRIIGAAIDLGYGCLVFEALNHFTRCWSHHTEVYENEDVLMVIRGLEGFYKDHPELVSLPLFTFGASSGGMFSSVFVTTPRYKIQGQILFISIMIPEVLEASVKKNQYPPTAWIYMSRDTEFASEERINASINKFHSEQIPYNVFSIEPISLTARTFHERIPTITRDTSNYIFYRFQKNQWLDSDNSLIYNPRRKDTWKTFLYTPLNTTGHTKHILKNLIDNKDVLSEFLNTIYGEHEISFERSYEALLWLKQVYLNKTQSKV